MFLFIFVFKQIIIKKLSIVYNNWMNKLRSEWIQFLTEWTQHKFRRRFSHELEMFTIRNSRAYSLLFYYYYHYYYYCDTTTTFILYTYNYLVLLQIFLYSISFPYIVRSEQYVACISQRQFWGNIQKLTLRQQTQYMCMSTCIHLSPGKFSTWYRIRTPTCITWNPYYWNM